MLLSKAGELKAGELHEVREQVCGSGSLGFPPGPTSAQVPLALPHTHSRADGGAPFLINAFGKGTDGSSFIAHAASPQLWSAVIHRHPQTFYLWC